MGADANLYLLLDTGSDIYYICITCTGKQPVKVWLYFIKRVLGLPMIWRMFTLMQLSPACHIESMFTSPSSKLITHAASIFEGLAEIIKIRNLYNKIICAHTTMCLPLSGNTDSRPITQTGGSISPDHMILCQQLSTT